MNVQLTLKRPEINKLAAFIRANKCETVFVAKDQGAYFGASVGADNNCIFYFQGCDPAKDNEWYETAREKFGGDDFGERLPVQFVLQAADNPSCTTLRVLVTATQIKIQSDGTDWNKTPTTARAPAEEFKLSKATIAQLVEFCRESGWRPSGTLHGSADQPETFTLTSSRGSGWTVRFINDTPDDSDGVGDHVNDMDAVTLEVNGAPVGMTWGEATELVNAMARILGIAMFG